MLSTDTFRAYYRDEDRLALFKEIKIGPFTHSKQEGTNPKENRIIGPR